MILPNIKSWEIRLLEVEVACRSGLVDGVWVMVVVVVAIGDEIGVNLVKFGCGPSGMVCTQWWGETEVLRAQICWCRGVVWVAKQRCCSSDIWLCDIVVGMVVMAV